MLEKGDGASLRCGYLEDSLLGLELLRMLGSIISRRGLVGESLGRAVEEAAKDSEDLADDDRVILIGWVKDCCENRPW